MKFIELNGEAISINQLPSYSPKSDNESYIKQFILDWHSGVAQYNFNTSGSTGAPKSITLDRNQLIHSANSTIKALNLKPNTRSLLCINPAFIGGTMMIVRSIINNMDLVFKEPSSKPFENDTNNIDFAAFVPLQIHEILKSKKLELENINNIIIGGGPVSEDDQKTLAKLHSNIYSTYGMTETVSHIALKRLSHPVSNSYKALPDVSLSVDDRNCLIINSPVTNNKDVITNDVVKLLTNNEFQWIGRADNIINSGGIKLQLEQIENKIKTILTENGLYYKLFLFGKEDEKLGEKLILVLENNSVPENLFGILKNHLNQYECPKQIISSSHFILTDSGKIDKKKTIDQLSI